MTKTQNGENELLDSNAWEILSLTKKGDTQLLQEMEFWENKS